MGTIDETAALEHFGRSADYDLIGRQIGRYLIQQRLGSGGVATVYRAYDQVQGQSVALKLLQSHTDERTLDRFRREAFLAGALRHPHIVRILQVGSGSQASIAYIAMELVEGESLADLLARRGRLHAAESCILLEPIARALAFAHAQGIIHRDVKPSNILLRPASRSASSAVTLESLDHPITPLLSDFGIARFIDAPELTSTGRTVGTPAFMAPEQCEGSREIDSRADIYALGAVLYRCVVGRTPFAGSATQMLHAHVYEPLTIDDAMLQQMPPLVVELLRHSLAKLPAERYGGADEMAEALHVAAEQTSVGEAAYGETIDGDRRSAASRSVTVLVPGQSGSTRTDELASDGPARAPVVVYPAAEPANGRKTAKRRGLPALGMWFLALLLAAMLGGLGYLARGLGQRPVATPTGIAQAPTEERRLPAANSGAADASLPTPTWTALQADRSAALLPLNPPVQATRVVILVHPTAVATTRATPTATRTEAPIAAMPPTSTVEPTALPTATPQPVATVVPIEGVAVACAYLVDPILANAIAELAIAAPEEFACADDDAQYGEGELLPFEHGFMVRFSSDSRIYIYYSDTQQWEWKESGWREGDPPPGEAVAPDASGLFLPQSVFAELWVEDGRRSTLGFATAPEPQHFSAVLQTFPGGILMANVEGDQVYLFRRSGLIW